MSKTTEFKLPKSVTAAIAAYKAHVAEGETQAERVRARNEEQKRELAAAEAELQAAMDRTIADPTPENEQREADARRKVAELKMHVAGGDDRATRAFQTGAGKAAELARKAITVGIEESRKHWDAGIADKLQAVADAKYAYLKSLVDLHTFKREAAAIWFEAGRQTNPNLVKRSETPNLHADVLEIPITAKIYGMMESEVVRAAKHGEILHTSVGKEREITQ